MSKEPYGLDRKRIKDVFFYETEQTLEDLKKFTDPELLRHYTFFISRIEKYIAQRDNLEVSTKEITGKIFDPVNLNKQIEMAFRYLHTIHKEFDRRKIILPGNIKNNK